MTAPVRFAWHELQTRDCAKALRFYEALFGWTTVAAGEQSPRERRECRLGSAPIGAVTISQAPAHVPAFWMPHLVVVDVVHTVDDARRLGARVLREPAPAPDGGRWAVVVDPRGAVFALRDGTAGAPVPSPGAFCWDELLTDDAGAATAFYVALTGCSVEPIDMGPLGIYRILVSGGRRIAGVMKHPENVHPHWLPYLSVRDVDAATARAVELGALLYFPPRELPGVGRVSGIDDPTGAGVCLLQGSLEGS